MKRMLPIMFSFLLCHCGTEVGNGVAPEDTPVDATAGTDSAQTSTSGSTNESSTNTPTIDYVLSASFIAACASPFAEAIEGTFVNPAGTKGFKVTPTDGSKKTVSRLDDSQIFVITPAPSAGPYAIEALPIAAQVTCGTVSSQTLSTGTLQRSVTLGNGSLMQWTLSGGQVISMKLTASSMSEETWNKR